MKNIILFKVNPNQLGLLDSLRINYKKSNLFFWRTIGLMKCTIYNISGFQESLRIYNYSLREERRVKLKLNNHIFRSFCIWWVYRGLNAAYKWFGAFPRATVFSTAFLHLRALGEILKGFLLPCTYHNNRYEIDYVQWQNGNTRKILVGKVKWMHKCSYFHLCFSFFFF